MNIRRKHPLPFTSLASAAVAAALASVFADILFYNHAFGWNTGLFVLVLGAMVCSRPVPRSQIRAIRFVTAGLVASVGATFFRGGILAATLSIVFLVVLAAVRVAEQAPIHAPEWLWNVLRIPCGVWQSAFHDVEAMDRLSNRRKGARSHAPRWVWRVLRQWALPLLLGCVFLAIFRRANPLIERGIEALWDACRTLAQRIPDIDPLRILLWGAAGATTWALLRPHRALEPLAWFDAIQSLEPDTGKSSANTRPISEFLTPAFSIRCLAMFNAVFAAQTTTDLAYLFGGLKLPEGLTYAQYAHRGAYPLLAAALLSAGITLLLFVPGSSIEGNPKPRTLVLAWLAQNVFLTFTAFWRLRLYVAAYSLTRLRLAACVWMGLVAFGLVSIAWRIIQRKSNTWLLDRNAFALLFVLLACAWWPMEGFIASHNVRHASAETASGQGLDLEYLASLGPEAIPALERHQCSGADRSGEAARLADRLRRDLRDALRDPMFWTWRRHRLKK